ncbi:hypothetical protein [Saccharibacillus endophyticus]|uniref:DUF4375 domain-containing protein n=1 Tax=Saccharibacillus endophyticus TaxID=2060666 RepID=A0ABQ1ZZI3_9BACL|nr:hypothetical protein [Saccharibacillus endophyticus]GGH81532.1 hypothetical protein GCM10007362_31470 [Saccharibacillus endophyticus]
MLVWALRIEQKGDIQLLSKINQQLYEIENIGAFQDSKMLGMIELLKFDPGNIILFQHLTANHGSGTSEDLEFLLEAFIEGYLGFKESYKHAETEANIKKLLSEHTVKQTMEDTEQLYQRFLNAPEVFEAALIDSIKHCIYDAVVSELAESAPDFIVENTICTNFLSVQITEA